jgi:PAS domain S-box-containing protein
MSEYPSNALQNAVEAADDAVYITDRTGTIVYVNEAVGRITGYSREALLGSTPQLFSSGLTSREYYGRMWGALLAGDVWREAITNRNARGELYECTQSITPLTDGDGSVTGFIAIQRDMTAQSSVQYEMRRARSEIERALEEKEMLLRELSHRTKNDLELLRSMLSLQSHEVESEEAREVLFAATERIAVMSRIYRLFHERATGKGLSLRPFLDGLATHWRETFFGNSVRFSMDTADAVVPERILVAVGLLTNELITNAAKYSRSGAVGADEGVPAESENAIEERTDDGSSVPSAVHVEVQLPASGTIQLTVTDNGPGFPAGILDRSHRRLGLQIDGGAGDSSGAQAVVILRIEW